MAAPLTPAALEGVRVLDLTDKSCVYATKILCDLGAEVVRLEPPGGDPMRSERPFDEATGDSLFHAFMNVNKRSVSLDLTLSEGKALFSRLLEKTDIVVESFRPGALDEAGIGWAAAASINPSLVWVSVTPFGGTGPYAQWRADDLVAQAVGGLMALSGRPDREPLRLYGEQSCYIAGLHSAAAALIAYWHASMTGEGQHVDVSIQECIAHTLENAIQFFTAEGRVRGRTADRPDAGAGIFPCLDGEIFLMASSSMIQTSWRNMVALLRACRIEGAEDLTDPKWEEPVWRTTPQARGFARDVFTRFTSTRTKNQVYDITQQHHVLSAPMNGVGDLFDNAQLKFLDWFKEQPWAERTIVWPGPPIRLSETPRRAPLRIAARS